jgi:hypothetical protein
MTHMRAMRDDEGRFGDWRPEPAPCPQLVPISGLPCGHPVESREWDSNDGAYTDYQFRCLGGGHLWWVDGIDA